MDMQRPTYTKQELQLNDRLLDRVLARQAWGRWLRLADALLRWALRRRLWGLIGRYLETVRDRIDNRVARQAAVVGPRPAPQGTEGTEKVSQSRSATSRRILLTGNGDFYVVNHVVPSKNALTL